MNADFSETGDAKRPDLTYIKVKVRTAPRKQYDTPARTGLSDTINPYRVPV